jgi:transcriptional regulator with XRE-family HTH domain
MSIATPRFSGDRLKAAREALGLSREELAVALGRGYPSICNYETGINAPPMNVRGKLARILGCTPADLMAIEPVEPDDA